MDWHIETKCIQEGWKPANGQPRVLPIVQSTTFKYDTAETMGDLFDLKISGDFYTLCRTRPPARWRTRLRHSRAVSVRC